MANNPDQLVFSVRQAAGDAAYLDTLSEEIVPVMMHLMLKDVGSYIKELEPLLDTLEPGTEEYSYLLIILSFARYRQSHYPEVINTLNTYEIEYDHTLTDSQIVSINALIGACYRSLGQTEFSLEYFQRNIPYTDIKRNDQLYFYSITLYHIAELYGELHEYEAMLNRHLLNLEFFNASSNADFYFRTLNGIGRAYRGLQEYDEALKYLLDVEEESREKGNIPFRARNLNDLGSLYAELNNVDESLNYFGQAFDLRKNHKLINASISTRMEMGRVLISDDRLEDAITLLEQALQVAQEIDVKKKQFHICRLLSEAYEKNSQIEKALAYYKQFFEIKDQVDNVAYTQAENQRMREMNTILEEQKKLIEEQNFQIEESNKSIQALNENLEALVDERTRQLQSRNKQLKHYAFMNAHEVRGPLSTILGLLQIADEFSSLEEKTELIQMIEVSASKLDGTIKDMHRNLVTLDEGSE